MVSTVDGGSAGSGGVLPDTEAMVDKGMVHPEDGVAGARGNIGHDTANAVVAKGVGTKAEEMG